MSKRKFFGFRLFINPPLDGGSEYYGGIKTEEGSYMDASGPSWQSVYDLLRKALSEYYQEGGDVQNGNAKDGQEKG